MKNSTLFIDKSILKSNIESILASLPEGCSLIPVLKDNAFNLGVENIAPLFFDISDIIAVAHVSEGIELRSLGYTKDILVLGNPVISEIKAAADAGLTLSISRLGIVPLFEDNQKVQLEFDSGLNRSGLTESEIPFLLEELNNKPLNIKGAYSHHGNFDYFISMCQKLEYMGIDIPFKHYCDSAGFENHPEYALNAVRLGRRLYMDAPLCYDGEIKEAVSWHAYITAIKEFSKGTRLGYSGDTVLERNTKVAIISVGYGDGLNLALVKEKAPVLIGGKRCSLLSTFMDQSLVDITNVNCNIGDTVTLFGYDENGILLPSQELAQIIDDEGVYLYSQISQRVDKIIG